jgi:sugar lactone lactonase YvrE
LTTAYQVDERRVYSTGFSNGALFSYVLLLVRPERFAAFAPVGLHYAEALHFAGAPRPVLMVTGSEDQYIPMDVAEWSRDQLLRLDGCNAEAIEWGVPSRAGAPRPVLYQPCASGRPVVWSRHGGGHEWPKDATANVVRFFKENALPEPLGSAAPLPRSLEAVIAGHGSSGLAGDGGPAGRAQLHTPTNVAIDALGSLLVSDRGNERIRAIGPDGVITTVVSPRLPGLKWLNRKRENYFTPEAIIPDRSGNLFIADSFQRRVIQRTIEGTFRVVAGVQPPDESGLRFSGDGGPATQASISILYGLTVDASGNLYFSDTAFHRVRMVDRDGIITTVAGTGTPGFSGDGGPAAQAQLYHPWGLAIDREGSLLIADAANHRVRKMRPDGTILTVAGTGTPGFSGDGGPALTAQLSYPTQVAADSQGSLFIVDTHNRRVRRVGLDGTIRTVVGEGGTVTLPLHTPGGIAIDRAGNLFIADTFMHVIRQAPGVAAPGLIAGQPLP